MRFLAFIVAFGFSLSSYASFYQISCSNADASIKTGQGHRFNGVALTVYTENGHTEMVEFSNDEITVSETQDSVELRKVDFTSCVPGQPGSGYMSKDRWYYQKVKLSRTDGEAFAENTLGTSDDRKTIETDFICHSSFNSRTSCP